MDFTKTTEQDSHYNHLEQKSIAELLKAINTEDHSVPKAVKKALPQIEILVKIVVRQLQLGGRLFYMGAGTSGRLGILDASECPPTFGVSHDVVIGLIAGGDSAIRKAVEFAEDDTQQGWKDLQAYNITPKDIVVGIAA
ncbi:MAG: N-acetylmuramic acid 6-phosphate etherase, partial [Flavobacteriaceae bacterium]